MGAHTAPATIMTRAVVPATVAAVAAAVLAAAMLGVPRLAAAQGVGEARGAEWNGPRALGLVERARERRREPMLDTTLVNYRADAQGHIYFYIDRERQDPVLLRADQVALELYWAHPDRFRQVIRGMRSEEQLPIRDFRYYLDRYTVIQNNFGDEIRVGEGRDVHDVPHPLAPGAEAVYDYRLVDSTTIRLPGQPEAIRVYELQVRPRDFARPAIVGSLFIERARADLVRLAFTFTPSAYLDRRNERVEVTLENALWEGRYWLPREQRLLVRREIPELDLDVGTVIRATLRVTDYELNVAVPRSFFEGPPVVFAAGPQALARYPFEEGLYDGLPEIGMAAGPEPGTLGAVDVHDIAGRILRQRYLRGVPRVRFYAPDVSSILRYDRAEGLVTGGGLSYGLGQYRVTAYGGYAWGAGHPIAVAGLRPLTGSGSALSAEAYFNRTTRLGLRPATAGVMASLSAALFGHDLRDLFFTSGGRIGWSAGTVLGGTLDLDARWERHTSPHADAAATHAPLDDDAPFRPVLTITEATAWIAGATWSWWGATLRDGSTHVETSIEAGLLDGDALIFAETNAQTEWIGADLDRGLTARQSVRAGIGGAVQNQRLLGGPNTLPGHPFHGYLARHVALLDIEIWRTILPRWIRARTTAAAALTIGGTPPDLPTTDGTRPWTPRTDDEFLGSIGVGLGFIDGVLRLDYAWPIGGHAGPGLGSTGTLILSVDPRFWPIL